MSYGRGEYRGIARVLIDGPDFQRLSAEARLVFLVTKIGLGPSGIDVIPAPLDATSERSGLPLARVERAVAELVASQWLAIEGNVVWIVKGLRHEPSVSPDNKNHVRGIRAHIAGLPRTPLVAAFIAAYPEWMGPPEEALAGYPEPMRMASDSHSIAIRITDTETDTETDTDTETILSGPACAEPDLFEEAWLVYPKRPNNPKAKARKAWRARIAAGVPAEELLAGVRAYAAYVAREGVGPRYVKLAATFFGPDEHWRTDYGPVEDPLEGMPPEVLACRNPDGTFRVTDDEGNPNAAARWLVKK